MRTIAVEMRAAAIQVGAATNRKRQIGKESYPLTYFIVSGEIVIFI
jgi:hypothetical protein